MKAKRPVERNEIRKECRHDMRPSVQLTSYNVNLYITSTSGTFNIRFPVKFNFLVIPVFI